MTILTTQQKKALQAQAHSLSPIVTISDKGAHDGVLNEIDRGLFDHELIKIKIPKLDKQTKEELITQITSTCSCNSIQEIGRIVVLYKKREKDAKRKEARPHKKGSQSTDV